MHAARVFISGGFHISRRASFDLTASFYMSGGVGLYTFRTLSAHCVHLSAHVIPPTSASLRVRALGLRLGGKVLGVEGAREGSLDTR